jgi:hypothetical protein
MVPRAAAFHHEDSDSIGPVAASAIISSRLRYLIARTFGSLSQMVKLHLGAIVYGRNNSAASPIRSQVADGRVREMYRVCVTFRDHDRNPDVLDPADGGLEQNAENKKALGF